MSGEVEALGGLVTAGLVADALDKPRKAAAPAVHGDCANCGTVLTGHFCGNCGQNAHQHRTLAGVGHEFVHGITHFDGKAWTTLPMLLFRPGKLTRDYIMGRRARYIAPVPLFLLVVFLMFFVFSFVKVGGDAPGGNAPLTRAQAVAALPKARAAVADIDRELAAARAKRDAAAVVALQAVRVGLIKARDRVEARARGAIAEPVDLPAALREEVAADKLKVDFGNESINVKVRKALKNPELAFYKVQGKVYKFSFLLVPLSLPWLWLVFAWKRGVRMYDHAIFALYSISFMSLLFVVGSIAATLQVANEGFWILLVLGAPLAHMFVQLKGAYALGNFSAAWRTGVLGLASVITLVAYLVLMLVLGLVD